MNCMVGFHPANANQSVRLDIPRNGESRCRSRKLFGKYSTDGLRWLPFYGLANAGGMRILAAIDPPEVTRKILECVGLPSRAPPVAPAASNHHAESDWS